jgi:hypothetical protein
MSKKLRSHVHVADDDGRMHVFEAGQVPPAWATKRITNRRAWEGYDEKAEPEAPAEATDGDREPSPEHGNQGDGEQPPRPQQPPASGSGSGVGAWAEYATALGVAVPEGASRAEIQAALAAAGHEVGEK